MIKNSCETLFKLNKNKLSLSSKLNRHGFSIGTSVLKFNLTNIKQKHQLTYQKVLFNTKIYFAITQHKFTDSLIESLQQYKTGTDMLEKGQYALAIRQYELALKFLPKQVTDNQNYKGQYERLLQKLLEAHIMMNKTIKNFILNYNQYVDKNLPFGKFLSVLQQIQNGEFEKLQNIETQDKLWKQLVRAFAFKNSKQCFGKHINIQKVNQTKDLALKYIGLYLYEKIKSRKNKQRQDIYLNTCRQLLKQTQQFQPSKIVKPLSLMASNLLAGQQYLQAEGLMSHCLTELEKFHVQNPSYLKTDQEYIMCKLLMGRIFEGVNRKSQKQNIVEQYGNLFDQRKFLIQQLLQASYRQL